MKPKKLIPVLLCTSVALMSVPAAAKTGDKVTLTFGSGIKEGGECSLSLKYSDESFLQSSKKYSPKLALLSAVTAASAYSGEDTVKADLEALGFGNIDDCGTYEAIASLTEEDCHKVAFTFATKELTDENGAAVTLTAAVIKGTGTKEEWLSNFSVGSGRFHEGFRGACDYLEASLAEYRASLGIEGGKLWICGHSRGAAVGNILAGDMADSDEFAEEDVFAYLFAPPNVVADGNISVTGTAVGFYNETDNSAAVSADDESSPYAGIYNIINPDDIITRLPVSGWGYTRFGKQLILPYYDEYDSYISDMDGAFSDLFGSSYSETADRLTAYNSINASLSLQSFAGSIDDYYNKSFEIDGVGTLTPYDYFYGCVAKLAASSDLEQAFSAGADDEVKNLFKTLLGAANIPGFGEAAKFFMSGALTGTLVLAHSPETYIAAVSLMDSISDYSSRGYYRVEVSPAENVVITDSEGNTVAECKGGKLGGESGAGSYFSDNVLRVLLPDDAEYYVRAEVSADSKLPFVEKDGLIELNYAVSDEYTADLAITDEFAHTDGTVGLKEGDSLLIAITGEGVSTEIESAEAPVEQTDEAEESTEASEADESAEAPVEQTDEAEESAEASEADESADVPEADESADVPEADENADVPETANVPEADTAAEVPAAPQAEQNPKTGAGDIFTGLTILAISAAGVYLLGKKR